MTLIYKENRHPGEHSRKQLEKNARQPSKNTWEQPAKEGRQLGKNTQQSGENIRQKNTFRKLVLSALGAAYTCIRPLLGPRGVCRFTPSCSEYAKQAVEKYGFCKGGWLAVKRICRCHPGCPGGVDPVP